MPSAQHIACILKIAHDKSRGVPQLIGEVSTGFQLLLIESLVVAGRVPNRQRESQSVSPVHLNELQRIKHISARLAHLHAFGVQHKPVQIHGMERRFAHVLDAHHHHSRNPEKKDVVPGFHHARRIEVVEVLVLSRPAQCGVRPQSRAEPSIQHIFVLRERA